MKNLHLSELHKIAGATFTSVGNWELPGNYGDSAEEYKVIKNEAGLIDQSHFGRIRIDGKDALDLLNRLSTYKVDILPVGTGEGTILLTNKGRVIDLVHLFAKEDGLMMVTSPEAAEQTSEWIDLYTFLEEVILEDVTINTAMLTLTGPKSNLVVEKSFQFNPNQLALYGNAELSVNDVPVSIIRTDPLGELGYSFVMESNQAQSVWELLVSQGASEVGNEAYNAVRIESGITRYGHELTERVNPWEVNLNKYIHWDKGCYTGQEVVLRLYNYNKVRRQLVSIEPLSDKIVEGAQLKSGGVEVGWISSLSINPVTRQQMGLGIVHVNHIEPDKPIQAHDLNDVVLGEVITNPIPEKQLSGSSA